MPLLLYVDDNQADIELLSMLLKQRGIAVEAVRRGSEATQLYDPKRHCAVLIDWNLMDMPGRDVARMLLMRDPACDIAFLSGLFDSEKRASAAVLGIENCFEKNMRMEHVEHITDLVDNRKIRSGQR